MTARCALLTSLVLLSGAGVLLAEHPLPTPHFLNCEADGNTVHLGWDALGSNTGEIRAVLTRDGEVIADLVAGDLSFDDVNVPAGSHVYTLVVTVAGVTQTRECKVVVGGDVGNGVSCSVDGRLVVVRWTVSDSIFARGFLVSRDGQIVGTLEADARTFLDDPPPGEHEYHVSTNNRPALDFLIGSCRVEVEGGGEEGVRCEVEGNVVTVRWVLPEGILALGFLVSRDNKIVATLGPDARSFSEEAPAGEHVYTVSTNNRLNNGAAPPDFLVGSCEVVVKGGLPAPGELSCAIAESFPIQVQLFWSNPVVYGSILVTRNNERIATLEGSATRFGELDPGPGRYVYGVSGILNGVQSEAVTCVVEIEGPERHRLFLVHPGQNAVDPDPGEAPPRRDALAVILANNEPVQGWSFGVCSDPVFLSVASAEPGPATSALNDGQGPTFGTIRVLDGGVTMAVIIDENDPADVLPPAVSHNLLVITYAAASDEAQGREHVVDFCQELGSPPVAVVLVVDGLDARPLTSPGTVFLHAFRFLRADANNDGRVSLGDSIFILHWLFLGGPDPTCMETADVNGTGSVNIADPVYLLQNMFMGGPEIPSPSPACDGGTVHMDCQESSCSR